MKPPEAGGAMSESLALVAPGRPMLDNLPVGLFGSVMGVTGLSVAWQLAHVRYGVPEVIALVIAAVAVVAFVLLVAGYAIKLVTAFSAVQEEFRHPVAGNLFGTILISLLQLPIVLEPFAHRLAQFFWTAGAAGMVFFAWLIVSRWMTDLQQVSHATPSWIIPVVGVLNVPLALPALGLPQLHGLMVASLASVCSLPCRFSLSSSGSCCLNRRCRPPSDRHCSSLLHPLQWVTRLTPSQLGEQTFSLKRS